MLMIIGLVNYLESGRVRVFNLGAIIAACLAGLGAVFVAANQTILPFGLTIFAPSETWRCALAVAGLVAWTLLPIAAAKARDYRKKLFLFCAGPVPVLMLVPFIYPAVHYQEHAPEPFLRKYADRIGPTTILVSDNTLVHAICWVYRREDVNILTGRTGELEYGLSYDDARHRLLDLDGLLDLIGKQSGQRRVTMILPSSVRETYLRYLRLTGMAGRLPAPRFEATENGLWVGEFGGDQSAEEPLPSLVPVRNKED
jgi:4-amino-4-deoxy-L-arabinose transferase